MSETVTVGVLALHNSKESKAILNAADDMGYDTEWLRQENTAVAVEDGTVTLEPEVDVVVNRLLLSKDEQPAEAIGLADTVSRLRPTLNPPHAVMTAIHKYATATALADAGVPVPDALLALSRDRLNAGRASFGDRAVYKTAIGTHGGGAWLVDLEDPVNPKVGNRQAFIQKFLTRDETRHSDLRVYVVDGTVVAAMNRTAAKGEWRTNVALGGEVTDVTDDLDPTVRDIAKRAADVVGLDYAGVDVIEGDDGWYVLEVNPTAGFRGLFKATGISPAPAIVRCAVERVGGSVDDERVRALSGTLDDSRPACAPRKTEERPSEPVTIGYTEEVVLTGTRGTKTVLAKADTGATRTSVDAQLAADVGTGPIQDVVKVKSGSVKSGRSRPVVDVVVGIGGTQHTVTASLEDRSHMEYPVLLGRDILQHYHVDVTRRADAERRRPEAEEE